VIGMLMLGFLANPGVNPALATTFKANGVVVSLAGGSPQFFNQLIGVAFTTVLAAAGTFLIVKLVDKLIGLRVDQEDESIGLDLSQHGERAYNE
jgi:Amt family ammonium transporter